MKKLFISFSIFMLIAFSGIAQNSKSGVYKTLVDYNTGTLEYAVDCTSEKHEIKLNEFLNESFITVKYKDAKIKLKKDSIYAVQTCDGSIMRFQNKEHFKLAEKGLVWIFYKETTAVSGKGLTPDKQFYFCTKGNSKLIELTVDNIKSAFPDNHAFHDMLEAQIKTDNDICAYDSFHKMYKVNHILNASYNTNECPKHPDVTGVEGARCPKCNLNLEKIKIIK